MKRRRRKPSRSRGCGEELKPGKKEEKNNHNGMRDKTRRPTLALPKDSAGGTERRGGRLDDASKVKETVGIVKHNFGECREGESESDVRSVEAADADVRRRMLLFQP